MDIEGLKYINDHYGREKADEVLMTLGQLLLDIEFKTAPQAVWAVMNL